MKWEVEYLNYIFITSNFIDIKHLMNILFLFHITNCFHYFKKVINKLFYLKSRKKKRTISRTRRLIHRAQENLNKNFHWEEYIDLQSSQKLQLWLIFCSVFHKVQYFLSEKPQSICKMVTTTDIFQKNLGHHLGLSFYDLVLKMFSTFILESGQSLKIEIYKISSHFSTFQVSF